MEIQSIHLWRAHQIMDQRSAWTCSPLAWYVNTKTRISPRCSLVYSPLLLSRRRVSSREHERIDQESLSSSGWLRLSGGGLSLYNLYLIHVLIRPSGGGGGDVEVDPLLIIVDNPEWFRIDSQVTTKHLDRNKKKRWLQPGWDRIELKERKSI